MDRTLKHYMTLPYRTEVREDRAAGDRVVYLAVNPELPGCMAQGDTPMEAVEELKEARREYIASMLEDGVDVPEPEFVPKKMHLAYADVIKPSVSIELLEAKPSEPRIPWEERYLQPA